MGTGAGASGLVISMTVVIMATNMMVMMSIKMNLAILCLVNRLSVVGVGVWVGVRVGCVY